MTTDTWPAAELPILVVHGGILEVEGLQSFIVTDEEDGTLGTITLEPNLGVYEITHAVLPSPYAPRPVFFVRRKDS